MIDELQELRQANPHRPEEVAGSVALPREELVVALRADTSRFGAVSVFFDGWRLRTSTHQDASRQPARFGWAAALAAIVFAVVALGRFDGLSGDSSVDVGEAPSTIPSDPPPATSDVVDVVVDPDPTSTAPDGRTATTDPALEPSGSPAPTDSAPATTGASTTTQPATTLEATTAPTTAPTRPAIDGPFDPARDLLVVHLDFAHFDDGHSALASREVTEWFGLDPLVVAGVASPDSGSSAQPYAEVMPAAWGSGWIDASGNRAAAVDTAAARWLGVLDDGGDVWVAEGGVSDFSAEIIRTIRTARPGLDTATRIHLVQHAQRNENETLAADLSEVLANADYLRIDDGNSANDTADLYMTSTAFETAALAGPRRSAWLVGFDYHPAIDLDFSDTVAVLHILGVGTDQVADPDDFASMFMSAG